MGVSDDIWGEIESELTPATRDFVEHVRSAAASRGFVLPDSKSERPVLSKLMTFLGGQSSGTEPGPPDLVEQPEVVQALASKIDSLKETRRARMRLSRDGQDQTLDRPIIDVPLAKLRTRLENVRRTVDVSKREQTKSSMETDGQLQPVIVVDLGNGYFELVAGFTRRDIASELGWKTIRAVVLPAGTSEEQRYWINLLENLHRSELSVPDVADRVAYMIETFGLTQAECARRIGKSEAWVSNLVRFRELPPEIWADARAGLVKTSELERMVKMSREQASAWWARLRVGIPAPTPSTRGRRKYLKRGEGRRPASTLLSRAHVAIRRCDDYDERAKELALATLDFALGVETRILDVYDPRKTLRGVRTSRKDDWDEEDRELPLPTHDRPEFAMGGNDE